MQDKTYALTGGMAGAVTFDYLEDVNFAMVHNHMPALVSCVLHNNGQSPWHDVTFRISGEAVSAQKVNIDVVAAGQSIDISKDLELLPDPDEMLRLTEPRLTSITISLSIGETEELNTKLPLRIMAYDQWLGVGKHPELLASFVMPNHPLLSRVAANASVFMQKWTGNGALDEYQSGDANRVLRQVAAVYEALRSEGLMYITSKASYEGAGQRIRTVEKVLVEKLGTCLDLTLLMASCLESIGIQPILVLVKDHAFVGAWLAPSIGSAIGDDASFLLKSSADGISDIVLVETTLLTSSDKATFDEAVAAAKAHLKAEDNLLCYINVAECRYNGIRPMTMRLDEGGHWQVVNQPQHHENATDEVKRIDRYDLSAYDGEGTAVTKYTLWERKLLDFSLHNNLLNMKLGRRIIPIVSFRIDTLEDKLQEGKSFRVAPFPLSTEASPTEGMFDSSLYPQLEGPITQQIEKGVIYSFHTQDTLSEALKYAYRSSRTSLEENGANNLYFVIGALRWKEEERRAKPLYAPLLLVPIEIVRGIRGSGYTIRTRDEETSLNITLTEMLKQQHGIDLSTLNPLPTDQSGVDVKKILAVIRDKIRDKRGWNVIDEAMIGMFSFSKFVMWNDIHANAPKLHANPIISSLVEGRLNMPTDFDLADAKSADRECTPDSFTIPIDVDSSQLEAIIDSGRGLSFILHGPPGTGKSQTITNMIANALYQGKRVLFVAEKMAALSVVQSRLEKIGLAPFCLELHSNKVTKQHFLRQMEMALDVSRTATTNDYKAQAEELYDKRCELMDYIEALHGKHLCGLSLYDCIVGYLSIEGDMLDVDLKKYPGLNAKGINEMRERIAALDTILSITGHPGESAYAGLHMRDGSASAEILLKKETATADALLGDINDPALIELCLDAEGLAELSEATDALISLEDTRHELICRYGQGILSVDLTALRREWEQANAKWILPRLLGRRAILKRHALTSADMDHLIGVEDRQRRCQATAYPHEKRIASLFGPDISIARKKLDHCQKASHSIDRICSVADIEVPPNELPEAVKRWRQANVDMREWYLWCKAKDELTRLNLDLAVDQILSRNKSGSEVAESFAKGLYHALARSIINSDDRLRHFNGLMFDQVIERYRQLTARFQQLSKQELYCRLASKMPSMTMAAHDSSEVGILKRNIKNGGRGTSIRKIIDLIPTLLPKLCPCMLMSPLSVAQYIDLNNEKFDIVIFDEASQMPTSEAVGAIARGKSLIVVGDPKQMPPTSFFATSAVGEDEADIDDMDSILDDCLALSIPSKHLTWHYRSKHESLIAFSNSQYYGGRLLTFPSVDDRERKVTLRHVDGVYQRGGACINLPEAQAVVNEVVRRLSDPDLSRLSIGIVSFSKVQQDKIEDLLTEVLTKHPDLETKAYESDEPIFIKNLENVQGDERDVILFSVGYGPDNTGKVSMNFGPLNNKGGERRLNVAVSRARHEMVVFSSMTAEHIDLRRTNSLGVESLKKFLEFAEKGSTSIVAASQISNEDSCVARKIAETLEANGYQTNLSVGRSQFKVDVAVIDPDDPDKYMLGIMLDGPSYYATKTMRDREIVQPSVLRGLRWNVMKVWTLDWFERPEKVTQSILAKIKEIKANKNNPEPKSVAILPQSEKPETQSAPEPKPKTEITPAREYEPLKGYVWPCPVEGVDEISRHSKLLNKQLTALVDKEQPITTGLIYKRILKLWGLNRITQKLTTLVDNALASSGLYTTDDYHCGKVWWTDAKSAESFSGYRTGSDRDIQDMPSMEIENAMRFVIDQQIALDREDLKRLTANQLGFTRKGSHIDLATDAALDALLREGYISISGPKVSKA